MLKDAATYQIMDPEELGLTMTLPLGKHSGRHAFARACERGRHRAGRRRAPGGLRAVQAAGRRAQGRDPVRRLRGGAGHMKSKKRYTVACLSGDGIGPELMAEASRALAEAGRLHGFCVDEVHAPFAGEAVSRHGHPLPASTRAACRVADAVLVALTPRARARGRQGRPRPHLARPARPAPATATSRSSARSSTSSSRSSSAVRSTSPARAARRSTAVGDGATWDDARRLGGGAASGRRGRAALAEPRRCRS